MSRRKARPTGTAPGALLGAVDVPIALLLAAVAGLAYFNSMHVPFQYDDSLTILQDPSVRLQLPVRDVFILNPFRPILTLTLQWNFRLGGSDPLTYHAVNLCLHLLNGFLFYLLLRRLPRRGSTEMVGRFEAAVASAVAVAHPLFTEAVTYISSRSTLQATAFLLLSLHLFLSYASHGRIASLVASYACVGLAAGTAEIGALAPLLWLVWLWLLPPPAPRRAWMGAAPGVLLLAAGAAYRAHVFFRIEYGDLPRSLFVNALTQAAAFTSYFGLWLLPRGLTIDHELSDVRSVLHPAALMGIALALTLAAAAWLSRTHAPACAFLLSLLLLTHLPASVFPLQEAMAEHRFYLPGFAACGMLALVTPAEGRLRAGLLAAFCALAGLLAVVAHYRNGVWATEESLWADAVAKAPDSPRALSNYADVLRERGDHAQAAQFYARALRAAPGNLDYTVNLGICLAHSEKVEEAEAVLDAARRSHPKSPKPLINLGNLCAMRGDYASARADYEQALALDPNSFEALVNMGYIYLNVLGDREKAFWFFQQAINMNPVRGIEFRPTFDRLRNGA